jgi:hypothetical protein
MDIIGNLYVLPKYKNPIEKRSGLIVIVAGMPSMQRLRQLTFL